MSTVSREAQIVYLTEWAARYRCSLQLNGQVGFGRDCVGILKDSHYIDMADVKGREAYTEGGDWWQPEDAYHKHDSLCVLGHDDVALAQLYEWVKWLDGHGYGVEDEYREPSSNIDLALHGISLAKLVRDAGDRSMTASPPLTRREKRAARRAARGVAA